MPGRCGDECGVFLCLAPADMRRSLDGLAALTREVIREDPLSGRLSAMPKPSCSTGRSDGPHNLGDCAKERFLGAGLGCP